MRASGAFAFGVELRAKTLLTRDSLGASLKKAEDLQHVSAPK